MPERTAAGAIKALRAGSFFGAHGEIVRELKLLVDAPGLPRPAEAGEAIEVLSGSQITVSLRFRVPETDWSGMTNRIDNLELVAVTAEGAQVVAGRAPEASLNAMTETIDVPAGGVVIRARGRRELDSEPDLMFYTNPVRVSVRAREAEFGSQ